jgi:hypothetical protein
MRISFYRLSWCLCNIDRVIAKQFRVMGMQIFQTKESAALCSIKFYSQTQNMTMSGGSHKADLKTKGHKNHNDVVENAL